jgi:hypothetical protein
MADARPSAVVVPATNAPAAADIRDIKPPVAIPSGWAWLAWLAAALVVLAVAAVLVRWWRRRARRPEPVIVIPPHVRARDRLRAALALLGRPEPFCVAISDALRVYLEERFAWHAPERTTEEFLAELQASPRLSPPQKRSLGDFLGRCDLVKFARYEPGEPELRDLLDAALRLVDETAPDTMAAADGRAGGAEPAPAPSVSA